ncbi:MAG: hypothetical protein J6V72_01285 [Kiritimatiellae bacterium]|nr:hypothetical protein [Kiritimatiellia bacterium]
MDSLIDIAAARALVADAALWPHVRDFLWDFAPQVHGSWLEDCLGRAAPDEGRKDGTDPSHDPRLMSSPRVKRFVLSALGIEPCFHAFPKDDWSRLILLDGQELELIVKWLGALACAGELRRVTDGKTVRALKADLPGIYPEVFGYTAYFKGDEMDMGDEAGHVVAAGFSRLMSLLAPLPGFLLSRLKFKLPREYSKYLTVRPSNGQTVNLPLLLKLRFPEAYRLCC